MTPHAEKPESGKFATPNETQDKYGAARNGESVKMDTSDDT